jgi:hypothetical protein
VSIDPRPVAPTARRARRSLLATASLDSALALGACAGAPADGPSVTTRAVHGCGTELPDHDVVPRVRADSFEAWVEYLTPRADELSWAAVDWLPTYAQGVAAAQEQRRPLLLWAMNGHPLGCT